MICVSIAEPTFEECLAALEGLELAEVRLDKVSLSREEIARLFAAPVKLIATCRPGGLPDEERKAILLTALAAGAAFVDIEVQSGPDLRQPVIEAARGRGSRVIMSYHNHEETPLRQALTLMVEECFDLGADIAKIVCRVKSPQDCVRLLSLYETRQNVIALGLGRLGVITRIAAPFLGAPLTYASLGPGKETAEGQPDYKTLETVMKFVRNG